jgi:hypothetical protein
MMGEFREGQTATHKDGRKIVWKSGAWRSLQGTGAPPDDTAQRISMRAAGLPIVSAAEDPMSRIPDAKHRSEARMKLLQQGTAELAQYRRGADMARARLSELTEFDQLNSEIKPTGGIISNATNWAASALGNEKLSRMDQLTASMARNMRQPGEGAVSDFDARQFLTMVGGYDKPYATNVRYSRAARALAERQIAQQQFREAFLQANSTLVGSDKMWTMYKDANPVFDGKGNVRKLQPAADWFAGRMQNIQHGLRPNGRPKLPKPPPSARRAKAGWAAQRVR